MSAPGGDGPDWIRWSGPLAVLGSALFLGSLVIQAVVAEPDSYQFDPALTSAQFLRDAVAPAMTVGGLASHLVLLVGTWLGDGLGDAAPAGGLAWLGRAGTTAGVAITLAGYAGLFTLGQGTGAGAALGGAAFAILTLVGVATLGLGLAAWGVALLRSAATRRLRAVGGLLLAVPFVGVVGMLVDLGVANEFVPAPYAVAFALLGYDRWRTASIPARESGA